MKKLIAGIIIAVSQIILIFVNYAPFFRFAHATQGANYWLLSLALYVTLIVFIVRIVLYFKKPYNKLYYLYLVGIGLILAVMMILSGGFGNFWQNFFSILTNNYHFAFMIPIADSLMSDFARGKSPSVETEKLKEIEKLKERIKKIKEQL